MVGFGDNCGALATDVGLVVLATAVIVLDL
jgi:hypothetical protein